MAVANPAFAPLQPGLASQLFANFTNGFYHGTVIWGFQQGVMVLGEAARGPGPRLWCGVQRAALLGPC